MSKKKPSLPPIDESSTSNNNNKSVAKKLSKNSKDNNNNDADDDGPLMPSPMWDGELDGWELTWPIWHMLPRGERKELAKRHGYKSIGEFEEYMTLQRAVGASEVVSQPYPNEKIYSTSYNDNDTTLPYDKNENDTKPPSSKQATTSFGNNDIDDDDEEEAAADSTATDGKPELDKQSSTMTEDLSPDELIELGGTLLVLHDEILHQIFAWLPVDTYGTLAMVSPHWKHLTRTESVYKRLCERLYLNQSKRRQLHVSRFGNSYRTMLEKRPRVRAAGGCYVMKYSHVKPIQRDMWTEIPVGAVLESVYYRYLYFQEDGRVLYALSSAPPHEMFRRLLKMCLTKEDDRAAVWGTFQVQRDQCTVIAIQQWHHVKFDLTIVPNSIYGRYCTLTFDRHVSSSSGNFSDYSPDLVEYKIPSENFHFIKDARL